MRPVPARMPIEPIGGAGTVVVPALRHFYNRVHGCPSAGDGKEATGDLRWNACW